MNIQPRSVTLTDSKR